MNSQRKIAAHYSLCRPSELTPRALISFSDGVVIAVEADVSKIDSLQGVEFYGGILIPVQVNKTLHTGGDNDELQLLLNQIKAISEELNLSLVDLFSHELFASRIGSLGCFEVGRSVGVAVIDSLDWETMRLTPQSTIRRIL